MKASRISTYLFGINLINKGIFKEDRDAILRIKKVKE